MEYLKLKNICASDFNVLDTKQFGDKLLPHSDLWRGVGGGVSRGNVMQHVLQEVLFTFCVETAFYGRLLKER
jgi:hypothetical protein